MCPWDTEDSLGQYGWILLSLFWTYTEVISISLRQNTALWGITVHCINNKNCTGDALQDFSFDSKKVRDKNKKKKQRAGLSNLSQLKWDKWEALRSRAVSSFSFILGHLSGPSQPSPWEKWDNLSGTLWTWKMVSEIPCLLCVEDYFMNFTLGNSNCCSVIIYKSLLWKW